MGTFDIVEEVLGAYGTNDLTIWALRFFLRNPYESTVVVDREGRVAFMDRGSEKFCHLAPGEARGLDLKRFFPNSVLREVAEAGVASIGHIIEVAGERKVGSLYPLIRNGEVIGAIGRMVFSSFGEIERINKEVDKLKKEITYFRKKEEIEHTPHYTFEDILGQSPLIRDAMEVAKKISSLSTDVLIVGESGTGKELFAHSIHNFAHSRNPFVRVNCPAIPFEIAESELFGYEKGAFSGALSSGKAGKFETAHNGTVFLDEITSLPLSIQAKILRVLQEREVERLGGTGTRRINFRLIAATNTDLLTQVDEGKFRKDLYYRVAKAIIRVPALRDRKEDIPLYVHHYLRKVNASFATRIKSVSNNAMGRLVDYAWPGNVRELINVLEQSALKAWQDEELLEEHLPRDIISRTSKAVESIPVPKTMKREVEERDREMICHALIRTDGDKSKAAALLGLPRSTLYQKMKKYRIRTQLRTVVE